MLYLSKHRVDKLKGGQSGLGVKKERVVPKEAGQRVKFVVRQSQYLTTIVVGEGSWLADISRSFTKRLMKLTLHLHLLNEVRNNTKQAFKSRSCSSCTFSWPFILRGLPLKMGRREKKIHGVFPMTSPVLRNWGLDMPFHFGPAGM